MLVNSLTSDLILSRNENTVQNILLLTILSKYSCLAIVSICLINFSSIHFEHVKLKNEVKLAI